MGKFRDVAATERNPKWGDLIRREGELYVRGDDIRSDFYRDYGRILHCNAYRRLKHKTQVFFATKNDHICTRIEHVNHVASVSYTISMYLGLNTELTSAIATGHDLGHAPFGHEGEKIINDLASENFGQKFWHEKNSLWFVDKIETLPDPNGIEKNLTLTYATRDGIICHCGEVDEEAICPRSEYIDLCSIDEPNQYQPYTWEGCVVKIADKISYLGRDIEDALSLGFLKKEQIKELKEIIRDTINIKANIRDINNTVLIHNFITNLCAASNPVDGIRFPEEYLQLINAIKEFNYKNIYYHPRLDTFRKYADLILKSIFNVLLNFYREYGTLKELQKHVRYYPLLAQTFSDWLIKYSNIDVKKRKSDRFGNNIIYDINNKDDYTRAVLNYLSGLTDSFAIRVFTELTSF